MTDETKPPEPQALARNESATVKLRSFLEGRAKHLEAWCKNINPAALIRFALLDYSQSPQLQRCTPESIYLALLACAQLGLEPGRLRQQAFIVPYKAEAQFQMGWRGYVALAKRAGITLRGQPVFRNDELDLDFGHAEPTISHGPALGDRGPLIGAYALAVFQYRLTDIEWMSLGDLEKVKAHATRGGRSTPAWDDWDTEMHRKAPLRRLGKRLPLSEEWSIAAALDDSGGDFKQYRETLEAVGIAEAITEQPSPSESGRLAAELAKR